MAQQDLSLPVRVLKALFPDDELEALARETKVIERKRKIEIVPLFWTLVLGFGVGAVRRIVELRRAYARQTHETLASSSFHDRFTPQLVKFLKACLASALTKLNRFNGELYNQLENFKDLVVADATVIRLHRFLESKFPGTRTNHSKAAAKVHMVMSLGTGMPLAVKLSAERKNERQVLSIGPWIKGKLLLVDLGYFKYQLFDRIDRNGGFFVTRLKSNVNPLIVASNKACRGNSVDLKGKKLRNVLGRLKRETLDVDIEVNFMRREYGGKRTKTKKKFRMVAVLWKGEYRLYLTNIPPSELDPHEIAQTYRCRWEIELVFKELKSNFRVDQLDTANEHAVAALIYTALIAMVASHALHRELLRREQLPPRSVPGLRWSAVFTSLAPYFLYDIMNDYLKNREESALWKVLLYEALDPNRSRALICGLWGGEVS